MAKKRANLTDLLNDLTYRTIFLKYRMIAENMFEWSGLPEGIEEKYIERVLFEHGKAVFFRDPGMDYMCLEAQESGEVNVYGEPIRWRAYGFGYSESYPADDVVIIDNNKIRMPTADVVTMYANKLAECERTMDVNVKAVKTPYILACDDKDVLTVKRIFSMIDGNTPAIYVDKNLNLDAIAVLQTGVKFLGNELQDYKTSVENELLTFLGQNNTPIDKKERTNTVEVNSNNQLIKSFAELGLEARKRACEQIKKVFGLDVSVNLRVKEETPDVLPSPQLSPSA